jgi:ribonuclease-3
VTKKPEQLASKLGLTFEQFQLFKMALTHRSVGASNNERLEFLGDSVLGFVIAEKLYEKFPAATEGQLSRLRASLVNQKSLAGLARQLNLGDYLILGSGELKSGGYRRDSILSDAIEAIMGAIVKDQGVEAARTWILELFAEKLSTLDLKKSQKDPKTRLQELIQSQQNQLPEYELLNTRGMAHEQEFTVSCKVVDGGEPTIGHGRSRKRAEQAAAEAMLKQMEECL